MRVTMALVRDVVLDALIILLCITSINSCIHRREAKAKPVAITHQVAKVSIKPQQEGLRFDIDSFSVEKINKKGDIRIPPVKGTVTIDKPLKPGDKIDFILDTDPEIIPAFISPWKVAWVNHYDQGNLYGTAGVLFEVCDFSYVNFPGYSLNLGVSTRSPLVTFNKELSQNADVFIGNGGNWVFGLSFRF